jgi:hypothetical protein
MIPASKAAETLNSLVDVLKDFEPQRRHISTLHERRIQGLVDKVPASAAEKPIARIMQACFLRDFETADAELTHAVASTWHDSDLELNVGKGMSETFQFSSFLSFMNSRTEIHQDDPDFLYRACYGLDEYGLYNSAWEVCCQLEKLNAEPHEYHEEIAQKADRYRNLDIRDEAVADFLTIAMMPVRKMLLNNPQIAYELSIDAFDDSDPNNFAFVLRLDATTEDLLDLADSISDQLSVSDLDETVDEHFACSVWAYDIEEIQHAS